METAYSPVDDRTDEQVTAYGRWRERMWMDRRMDEWNEQPGVKEGCLTEGGEGGLGDLPRDGR